MCSMISEQVKELRTIANNLSIGHNMPISLAIEHFIKAADTIEVLFEKVRAANMERSTAYYNNGWIPVEERLPEPACRYLATVIWIDEDCIVLREVHNVLYGIDLRWHTDEIYKFERPLDCKVIAWIPLPESYKPE